MDSQQNSPGNNFTFQRAYTTGGKLGARQMFVFNEDGTIAGLKEVPTVEQKYAAVGQSQRSRSDLTAGTDKKFGRISS